MTRVLGWVLAHSFVLQLTGYVVRPASAYRALELGVAPGLVGLIAASFALVPLVVAVAIGRWNDRGHQSVSLALGATLMLAGGVGLLVWAQGLVALLLWNAVVGLGHLMSILGEQTRVAQLGGGRLDSAFGTFTFAGTAGQAVAPLLLAVIGGSSVLPDTTRLFWLYLAAATALALVTLPLLRAGAPSSPVAEPRVPSLRSALQVPTQTRRTMGGALLLSTLVLAAIDLVQVYLPALGVERGIPSGVIGILLTVRAVATMASRARLAALVSWAGRRRLVVTATMVAGIAMATLSAPLPVWAMGLVMVVLGLGLGIGQPLSMAIVATAAPAGTVSTWLALRLTGNRVGQAGVPALVSAVAAGAGVGSVFAATAAGLVVTAAACRALLPYDG